MPKDEFDPQDPLEAIAVELPCDEDTLVPMAEAFIEEYLRMGKNERQILALFDNPFYAGMHLVYRARGAEFVRQLIADTFAKWRKGASHV